MVWGARRRVCVRVCYVCMCVCVGQQMSNSQAELQGHSHKDKSDQGLHQRPDIPQSVGLRERSRVNTFSA